MIRAFFCNKKRVLNISSLFINFGSVADPCKSPASFLRGSTPTNFIFLFQGERGSRTPLDKLCRLTHDRSATSPECRCLLYN